jgi:hypothetical protein
MSKEFKFVIPLLLGGTSIVLLAIADRRLIALFVGVATILLHWGLTADGKDEETADSSYFLGFLLTLALLVVGLANLGSTATGGSPEGVLLFLFDLALGLALTVVGLAVRQMRVLSIGAPPINEQELLRKDLKSLVESQTQLAGNISELLGTLSGSALGETIGNSTNALEQAQEAAAALGNKITLSAQAMDTAVRELEAAVRKAAAKIDETSGRATEQINRGQELLQANVASALEHIKDERNLIDQSLQRSTAAAEKAQAEIGKALLEQVEAWRVEMH